MLGLILVSYLQEQYRLISAEPFSSRVCVCGANQLPTLTVLLISYVLFLILANWFPLTFGIELE